MSQKVDRELTLLLPKMRIWALALTRDRTAAEDLAQDVATKVLAAQETFMPGTNFSAWVHRIMVNHFISEMRSRRAIADVENLPEAPVPPAHEDRIALRELGRALDRLPANQQQALSMIVLQEKSYEAASAVTGEAIGTLKSRVHRARRTLHSHMMGERPLAA